MNYAEAVQYLGGARRFGVKLGLEPMENLASALGTPQKKLRFIHLAGTNGKGSTAAFCESCLRAAGFHVGLYTSPHLVSVRERIQIDRVPISEADFAAGMEEVRAAAGDSIPTFFELMTALALRHFARERVDWVVWETGLGGRLDATNIVRPEITIITNIALDHQQHLGHALEDIAAEKAGIIKPGVPVVSGVEAGPAAEVICRRADLLHAPLLRATGGDDFALGLRGSHQKENAACAIRALRSLSIPEIAIAGGLEKTTWPGRFEILSASPLIVLDGAHNEAGMKRLIETWREYLAVRGLGSDTHLVFASVNDKDISGMATLLRPLARRVSLVRLQNERSSEPVELAPHFEGLPCAFYDSVTEMWRDLPRDLPVLITGSLFLAGEVLAQLHGGAEEYRLNEQFSAVR